MIRTIVYLLCLIPFTAVAQSDVRRTRSLPAPPDLVVLADHDQKVRTSVSFRLCLDPQGQIACLEPLPGQDGQTVDAVMQRVPGWRFTPAHVDGVPVSAESTLTVFLEGEADTQGGYTVRITRAVTSPRSVVALTPKYPSRELRRLRQGSVLLQVDVRADGSVGNVVADDAFSDEHFVGASVAAVRRWTFLPELVDGRPVPTRVMIPVLFRIAGEAPVKPRWHAEHPSLHDQPMAIDSAIGQIIGPGENGNGGK